MAKTAMTHARLTPEVKERAEAILKSLGISISTAYEMFYRQIIAPGMLSLNRHISKRSYGLVAFIHYIIHSMWWSASRRSDNRDS